MFSWLKDLKDSADKKMKQWNNANFKQAMMASCALVSASDGQIEPEEKKKVADLIKKNELLQVFDAAELRDLFLDYANKAADDFDRIDLLNIVGKIKSNNEQATTAVRVALLIANADGEFEDCEKKVVEEICTTLELNAADFIK